MNDFSGVLGNWAKLLLSLITILFDVSVVLDIHFLVIVVVIISNVFFFTYPSFMCC